MRLLKDAQLQEVKDSGHAAPVDQPEQVSAAISSFVRGIEARGPAA